MAEKPLNPFDYAERFKPRSSPVPVQPVDPLTAEIRRMREQDLAIDLQIAPKPEVVARSTAVAKRAGAPPALVEDRLDESERELNIRDLLSTASRHVPIARLFAQNPRISATAQGDHAALGMLGRAWEFLSKAPDALSAGASRASAGLQDLFTSIDEAILPYTNPSRGREILNRQREIADNFRAQANARRPKSDSFVVSGLLAGVESAPASVTALVAGAATRNPNVALGVMGATTAAPSYQEARRAGKSVGTSLRYGVEQGAIEVLTEKIPAGRLIGDIAAKTPLGRSFVRQLAAEIPGEQVATVLQDFSTWATLNPEKPFSEYLAERPDAALTTALATISGTSAQVGAVNVLSRSVGAVASVAGRVDASREARREAHFVEKVAKASEQSELRKRDPDAYGEVVKAFGADSGVSHVLVDGEAVREYMQSDRYDPDSDPFSEWVSEVEEASAIGGDLVLPVELVLGTLPGTPAWEAVKDNIRLSPGGMTNREAQSFDGAMDDIMAEITDTMARDDAAGREAMTVREQLLSSVSDKLTNAGLTPVVASQHAELIVSRAATRAARMGRELTPDAFQTDVVQVLPPELAAAKAADGIDLVINALRKGGDATRQEGLSLLEWIAKRGGIEDRGGDIAAMGGDKWHRGKVGRRKLLKPFEAAQGNMLGGASNDNSLERLFDAAISEGFFPDLFAQRETAENYADLIDVQAFKDAIGSELRGSPVYASEAKTDQFRAAADELRQMLAERGLDPDSLSDAEVRQAIDRFGDEVVGPSFDQSFSDGPRGRIVFNEARATIELFQARNLSTLLHELSHQWLEELRIDAESPEAPAQLKADWQAVQDWFAANGHAVQDGVIPVEAHELFARGGERFIMEGKAPSTGLARIFEAMRGWMVSIYKTVNALRSPITPEIREVFERLIASDDEIAMAREHQALSPLFKDVATSGMTGPEFDAYRAQFDEARATASGAVIDKAMRSVRARVSKEWRDAKAGVEAAETERLDTSPVLRSLRLMKADPVNREWVSDTFGIDAVSMLPRGVTKDGGVHPDALAELSGYQSGRQMIEALIGVETAHRQAKEGGDKRTLRARMIDLAVQAEMDARYGDPFTDGTIEREALAAVNGEMQGEVLASEIRILARNTGQRPTPYRIAREWARNKVRQGVYQTEASPSAIQRHARTVAKAGREAEKAILAGNNEEALRFKQQQMLSSALLAEAKAAHDEVSAAQKRLDNVARRATMKTVDQDYLEQAHALLEAVDLRERTQKSLSRKERWADWAAAREADGYDIVVPASFAETLGQTNWTRLPVETMLALDDAVKQVLHLGRMKQRLLDNQEQREWAEIEREAVEGAGRLIQNPPRDLMPGGFGEWIKGKGAGADAALLKMETVFDWLDGGDPNGVFNRIAFRPIADAQASEQDMLVDYYGRIKSLFAAVPEKQVSRWADAVVLPFTNRETGLPERVNRQQLLAAALNVGNEGNLQRLTDGYGWNASALLGVLNAELTAEEWHFVQGVWDTIETLWPLIEGVERRVNGVAPEKVEARDVVTPYGTLKGGYYPAIYDSTRDYRAEENRGRESDLFESHYTRATTRASATKARSDQVTRPILLDLGVINRHLGEVIHDLTHREPVMRANRFLTSERVMRAVDEALGQEIRKQFRPWVKFVANSWAMERAGNEGFGKFLTQLRANVTAVGMGLRATTMIAQIAGYSNSVEVVGEKWIAEAVARAAAHPVETFNYVLENSDEVRHRMDTLDRDIRNELARMTASNPAEKGVRIALDAKRFFFHGIGYMDRLVSVGTWMGAYNKAIHEGMDEADARYSADKAVRQSQGSGAPKDMAAIQRGTGKYGEALKLMTMFYTFFSAQYQRERTLVRDAMGADTRKARNVPRLAARAFWMLVLPPLLVEVVKMALAGGGPDDDEWWAQWTMRKLLANAIGPIPMARDFFEPAWNIAVGNRAFNPSISPVQRALETATKTVGDVGKMARGEETKQATRNIMETVGYATGLVPGQLAQATQFLVDVGSGDADPKGFADWVEGLSSGKLKD